MGCRLDLVSGLKGIAGFTVWLKSFCRYDPNARDPDEGSKLVSRVYTNLMRLYWRAPWEPETLQAHQIAEAHNLQNLGSTGP